MRPTSIPLLEPAAGRGGLAVGEEVQGAVSCVVLEVGLLKDVDLAAIELEVARVVAKRDCDRVARNAQSGLVTKFRLRLTVGKVFVWQRIYHPPRERKRVR